MRSLAGLRCKKDTAMIRFGLRKPDRLDVTIVDGDEPSCGRSA